MGPPLRVLAQGVIEPQEYRCCWPPIVKECKAGRLSVLSHERNGGGRVWWLDGYSSRSASTGVTLDARSAGNSDAVSTVARRMAAPKSSVRGSPGAMP